MRSSSMKRSLHVEEREPRLNMTAGQGGAVVAAAVHEVVRIAAEHGGGPAPEVFRPRAATSPVLAGLRGVPAAQNSGAIKGILSGGQSSLIPGTPYVAMGGFGGKFGNVAFQATMYGNVAGEAFQGGTLHLFNAQGTILADLGPGKLVASGKTENLKVEMQFEQGTGPYSPAVVSAGTVTFMLKTGGPASKPKAGAVTAQLHLVDWDVESAVMQLFLNSFAKGIILPIFG